MSQRMVFPFLCLKKKQNKETKPRYEGLVELMQAMMRQHEEQIKMMERKLEEPAKEFH